MDHRFIMNGIPVKFGNNMFSDFFVGNKMILEGREAEYLVRTDA